MQTTGRMAHFLCDTIKAIEIVIIVGTSHYEEREYGNWLTKLKTLTYADCS